MRAQRERVLCGGRATVGVAGGYPQGFAEQVQTAVAGMTSDHCVGRLPLPPQPDVDGPTVLLIDKPSSASIAVSMGMPIDVTRADPDYPALTLAAAYFGQHRQFVGKLMQEMREQRGLNYGDYAYVEHFDQDGWSTFPLPNISRREQYFSMWLRPVTPVNAHFAVRMAVRELRDFVENGMSEQDFDRVRTFAMGYYGLYEQTESRRLGFALDDVFYGQSQPWLERLRTAWQALTVDQVNAAIRRHIHPDKLRIAIVTPHAAQVAEALAADAPSPIHYQADVSAAIRTEDQNIIGYHVGIHPDHMQVVPVAQMFR